MRLRKILRRTALIVVAGLTLILALAVLATGDAVLKLDYGNINNRAGWQVPDRVIESLALAQGDKIADIGAGNGYFTFRLADTVGPSGKIYAVDVDEDVVKNLRHRAEERRYRNIEVVLGKTDDPLLPDGEIDIAFLCNAYHHIDDRPGYFARLKIDLSPRGRVALIDMRAAVPLVRMLMPAGHWTDVGAMKDEMRAAGYRTSEELRFLPFQNFLLFGDAER